jgi:4-diphosphocytidyl-2-C-methyl-D-erythritol kinase
MNTALPATWPAPAKLNLFLHITGRRADGYHLIQTVFQFLDFGDRLSFRVRDDGVVRRTTELAGIGAQQDLTVRAAQSLRAESGTPLGVDIGIDKRLPMGGGLGGGSSDAATTLVVLNRLWALGLDGERLAALGETLGADVPVFVRGHAAWAEGIGERLTPIDPPEPWYLVIIPPVRVATAALFAAPELTRDCHPITIRNFLSGQVKNVFEPVARQRYPEIAEALDWLARFGAARLTGSGACVFAAFADEAQAQTVWEQRPGGWRGFIARGCNISPLHRQLCAAN